MALPQKNIDNDINNDNNINNKSNKEKKDCQILTLSQIQEHINPTHNDSIENDCQNSKNMTQKQPAINQKVTIENNNNITQTVYGVQLIDKPDATQRKNEIKSFIAQRMNVPVLFCFVFFKIYFICQKKTTAHHKTTLKL